MADACDQGCRDGEAASSTRACGIGVELAMAAYLSKRRHASERLLLERILAEQFIEQFVEQLVERIFLIGLTF